MNTDMSLSSSTSSFGTDQIKNLGNKMLTGVNSGLHKLTTTKITAAVLGMFLILYSAKAAPNLPKFLVKLLDNVFVKILFIFLIAYIASGNTKVALITAVVLFLTIQVLSYFETSLMKPSASTTLPPALLPVLQQIGEPDSLSVNGTNIKMTPKQAEVVNSLVSKIDQNNNAAIQAESFGNTDLARNHRIEAFAAEMILDAAVGSVQHQMAAEEAKNNGDISTADAHMQEAVKLGEKADILLKAEQSKEAAKNAEQTGNMDEAKGHLNDAYELLNKAQEKDNKPSEAPVLPSAVSSVPSGNDGESQLAPLEVTTLNVQSSCLPVASSPVPSQTEQLNGYDCNEYASYN